MKEYQKPVMVIEEVDIYEILAISVNGGMFDMFDEKIGGFDEIW